ncbi:MAG: hypothetical protein CMJ78_13100 [Planctomycetaceae bacterium]|nr:hypothetical protein [Planctomycetaceae bacterium]
MDNSENRPVERPFEFAVLSENSDKPKVEFDVVQIALRHKKIISIGVICGLVIGHLAYKQAGPEYEATVKILVSKKADVMDKDNLADTKGAGGRGEHIALIMSPLIVGAAIEEAGLDGLPSMLTSGDPEEDIVDGLKVERSAGHDRSLLNVLDITYKNRNKDDARQILEAVVDAYEAYLKNSQQEHNSETRELIDEANVKLEAQLQAKMAAYVDFRQSAPLQWKRPPGTESSPADVVNVHQDRLEAIDAERRKNLLEREDLQSKIAVFEEAIASGQSMESLTMLVKFYISTSEKAVAPQTIVTGLPGQENTAQLLPLLIQEQRLLRDLGADHPDVQSVQSEIALVKAYYRQQGIPIPGADVVPGADKKTPKSADANLVTTYMASLRQQWKALANKNVRLDSLYDDEAKKAKEFSKFEAEDQKFVEEIARIKSLQAVIVKRLAEMGLVAKNYGYKLKQISPVRDQLVFKRKLKFWFMGLAMAMSAVGAVIYWREWRDTTLKTFDDVRQSMQFPVLGGVPEFAAISLMDQMLYEQSPLQPSLCYFHRPGSSEAEAYRSVRTALFVSGSGRSQAIQVSSPEPGDGKTTFISNLAIAIAQSGRKVLLIDADLRRPTVNQLFGLPQDIGTCDVLLGDIELPNAVKESGIEGLQILTAGTPVGSPAELLSSARMASTIEAAKAEYDFVLVDTPPLLAVSDPCIVAPYTDGLLMVVCVGKNKRTTTRRAADLLDTHNVEVLGVIANSIEQTQGNSYTYSGGYADYLAPSEQSLELQREAQQPTAQPVA